MLCDYLSRTSLGVSWSCAPGQEPGVDETITVLGYENLPGFLNLLKTSKCLFGEKVSLVPGYHT